LVNSCASCSYDSSRRGSRMVSELRGDGHDGDRA
jgi:hypothetical protein